MACVAAVTLSVAPPGEAAESLITFRPGPRLEAFAAGFAPDAREIKDPDAWGYLSPAVKGAIRALERKHGFRASQGYSKVLLGLAADLTPEQIEGLRHEPVIESITVTVSMAPTGQHVSWAVNHIGALTLPPREDDAEPFEVRGVTVYVVDSGIDPLNSDLNVVRQVNFTGGPRGDCLGHGTHVAGIIGARDNHIGVRGVAPGVPLVGVKVVDCSGSGSSAAIIKGIDWVTATAVGPAVVNLSLGGGASASLDAAVKAATGHGIFFAVAAGNEAADACLGSPSLDGTLPGVVTVGAVDEGEMEADFSNFGECVDMWAPGVGIASSARGPNNEWLVMSGTSMAAPHVAGAAALYLSQYPTEAPSDVKLALISSGIVPGTSSKDGRTILRLQIPPF